MKSTLLVFLHYFSYKKLDYHFSLQKIGFQEIFSISCFMWDVRHWCNLWDDTTHTPRQAWIIKCGIHLSWKAACTKHMSKFGSSSLTMLLEWTFLHPTFTKYTTSLTFLVQRKATTSYNRDYANATLTFYQTTVAQNSFVIQWVCQ